MKDNCILDEIVSNAKELPLWYQEMVLDVLKGMSFTKKNLIIDSCPLVQKSSHIRNVD